VLRSLLALLFAVAAACSPSVGPTPTASALADDRIQLLHTDDIHGHLDADFVTSANASSSFRARSRRSGRGRRSERC
jgi:2',3'-cyclic-nucleotide 2'-phosphodiesterase (5'-nucleotidase family)